MVWGKKEHPKKETVTEMPRSSHQGWLKTRNVMRNMPNDRNLTIADTFERFYTQRWFSLLTFCWLSKDVGWPERTLKVLRRQSFNNHIHPVGWSTSICKVSWEAETSSLSTWALTGAKRASIASICTCASFISFYLSITHPTATAIGGSSLVWLLNAVKLSTQ